LLEKSVKGRERARENCIELEALKGDIGKLQGMVKEASFGPQMENSEVERLRRETSQLERLLGDLK